MVEALDSLFKHSPLYPMYYRLRGWNPHMALPYDKNHVWIFNAGEIFAGNPKWLFIYMNKYRPDIKCVWLTDREDTVAFVRKLGYTAYLYKSRDGAGIQRRAGVYVVENVKEVISPFMADTKLLNLFHGVGCKSIEKKVKFGFLNQRIAKKYITYNEYYKRNQLFLVTSPLMEKHFKEQCDIDDDKVIRGGYPRCLYQQYFEKIATFDHNLLKGRKLPKGTKIAAYVPTYRDGNRDGFFATAIPDMQKLVHKLQKENMLLIFKMHPQMEEDSRYVQVKAAFAQCPNLLFWDNSLDFYEVFDQIDLAIIDYSSIFYDMLAAGVPHFLRYLFDYEVKDNIRDLVFDLKEMTCGKICDSFQALLSALGDFQSEDSEERERIQELFWSYSQKDSFENIIEQTLAFTPHLSDELPALYSFDIFDTLIARDVLSPEGIFYAVRKNMEESPLNFPPYVMKNYPEVRRRAEANVREYYAKTLDVRKSEWREISFGEIFKRMGAVHGLSREQLTALAKWELLAEYESLIPVPKKIAFLKSLVDEGKTVVLISDMYLPRDFILKLLQKADPLLPTLPLFLSSQCGVQKTTNKLFLKVYNSFDNYHFGAWHHYGDNAFADGKMPAKMGIQTHLHKADSFNTYERALVTAMDSHEGYLMGAKFARLRLQDEKPQDYFSYAFASLYFVPYINWVITDALERGFDCLYFISRDGHHLRQIADILIKTRGVNLSTKYIYGSRKAWRVPSFLTEVDEEFFLEYGNFAGVEDYQGLLKAMMMSDEDFAQYFPNLLSLRQTDHIDKRELNKIRQALGASQRYRDYLLERAAEGRPIIEKYFRQEIDFKQKFAFVEYWGRGYTQDCFARLLQHTAGKEIDVPYYYARSIYPTQGSFLRYNFTGNTQPLLFAEALFANLPYRSITAYQEKGGKVVPVIEPIDCDRELYEAMSTYMPQAARDYGKINSANDTAFDRSLFDFALSYYRNVQNDEMFALCLGPLVDAVETNGKHREYAPALSEEILAALESGVKFTSITRSVPISLARSTPEMRARYNALPKNQ